MAAIVKLPSGIWRAQVRQKGKYVTATFLRRMPRLPLIFLSWAPSSHTPLQFTVLRYFQKR